MRLEWNAIGTRFYEAGVDRGVLYVEGKPGVVWTGLTSVDENPSGGEAKAYYLDGVKYLNVSTAEEFGATLSAFTYPDEFAECDGTARVRPGFMVTQQRRKPFGLAYRTKIGNDLDGVDHAYKIHIIYNALAAPTQRANASFSEGIEPSDFSWSITTRPIAVAGYHRTAHIVIDSRDVHPVRMKIVEDILYGDDANNPRTPTFAELVEIFDTPVALEVLDLGDGIYRLTGTDDYLVNTGPTTAIVMGPDVVPSGEHTYTISSP